MTIPCNWLQIVENACDPIHNAYLHAIVSGEQFSAAFKVLPALDFVETPLGFLSMATRQVKDKGVYPGQRHHFAQCRAVRQRQQHRRRRLLQHLLRPDPLGRSGG